MSLKENFEEAGFLSREAWRSRHNIRAENRDWFELADDVNCVLMKIISSAICVEAGYNWSPRAVALRLLMRTATSFQGVVKLSELGMISPARTLVRTIVEDSFCAARIDKNSEDIISKLIEESESVRRRQANFILDNALSDDQASLDHLREAVSKMEKQRKIDWRNEAMDGELWRQYLNYMRLSDDSVHTSALSLDRHLVRNEAGSHWSFKMAKGDFGEITSTLHRAVLATIPIGIVASNIVGDEFNNRSLRTLSERFRTLPDGKSI